VWLIPSDFGSALEGFTKLLGAPGADGVFRYQPSAENDTPKPADDSEEVADWFNTRTDPDIAEAVAKAEAEARSSTIAVGTAEAALPEAAIYPSITSIASEPPTAEWPSMDNDQKTPGNP
jgi:hypothetical protein